jgi:hypothetical protein
MVIGFSQGSVKSGCQACAFRVIVAANHCCPKFYHLEGIWFLL